MITIGGIIGAGLFVGSSAAINAAGPAVIFSYMLTGLLIFLIMRMLGEMAVGMPKVRSFTEFARAGLGNWAASRWAGCTGTSGYRRSGRGIAGATILQHWFHWQTGRSALR